MNFLDIFARAKNALRCVSPVWLCFGLALFCALVCISFLVSHHQLLRSIHVTTDAQVASTTHYNAGRNALTTSLESQPRPDSQVRITHMQTTLSRRAILMLASSSCF